MKRLIGIMAFVSMVLTINAQVNAADSVMQHVKGNRLSVGGYGEVAYSRNFFSDHVSRYSQPEEHKDDPSHGRFDIPHAVIYLYLQLPSLFHKSRLCISVSCLSQKTHRFPRWRVEPIR